MHSQSIRDGLLLTLIAEYEEDPLQFLALPKPTVDSSLAREVVAELRNEGYVEEQVRGVIRLTARGYREYGSKWCPSFRKAESQTFIF
jgi:hypothetical protein